VSLKGESFINTGPEVDVGFLKQTDAIGTLGSFTPKVARRVKDMITVLSYVSAGQGVAVVSQAFRSLELPNVVYREFASATPPVSQTAFIYRRGESSPAGRALIKFVRRHSQS
jgi:DNA-binding transcriptional LysR family regulator